MKYTPRPILSETLGRKEEKEEKKEVEKRKPFTISLSDSELLEIDEVASERKMTRSAYVRYAVFAHMRAEKKQHKRDPYGVV